jgi:hypothetical protein
MIKLPRLRRQPPRDLIAADADSLIALHDEGAYDAARKRAREERLGKVVDANRPPGHWDKVRREIAKRTGREIGADAASRYPDS